MGGNHDDRTFERNELQFKNEVFPAEAAYLARRWENVYKGSRKATAGERRQALTGGAGAAEEAPSGDPAPGEGGQETRDPAREAAATPPSAEKNLVGLAFSGGGIRSATFNLGVAQALEERGVIDHVDYLSTVSGGGYLGSSMTTIMRDGARFPFKTQSGPRESGYLGWLRNHSNYLAERGLIDYVRLFVLLLRGVVLNFLILVPFLLSLSLLLHWHFAAPIDCGVPARPTADSAVECAGSELGFWNRGILTHWERKIGAREFLEHEAHAAEAAPAAGEAGGEAARLSGDPPPTTEGIKAMVGEQLSGVGYLDAYSLTPWAAGIFLLYYLLYPIVIRVFKVLQHDATGGNESSVPLRNWYELTFAKLFLAVAGVAALESLPVVLHAFHQLQDVGVVRGVVASVAGGSSVIALTLFGRLMQQFSGLTRKILMVFVGLLGMLLPLLFILYVAEKLIWEWRGLTLGDSRWLALALFVGLLFGGMWAALAAKWSGRMKNTLLRIALVGVVFLIAAPVPFVLLRASSAGTGWLVLKGLLCLLLAWAGGLVSETATARFRRLRTALGGRLRYLLVALIGAAILAGAIWALPDSVPEYTFDAVYLAQAGGSLEGVSTSAGVVTSEGINPDWFLLALALTIWLFSWASLDINLTSFHGVYRDRLAEAYLVGVDEDAKRRDPELRLDELPLEEIAIEADLDLTDICQKDSVAPYHLVNVAHNLQGSDDPGVRDRFSDFFVFSKRYYGGNRTGYAASEELEAIFPQMDLATAMAISAAAAAPNMGKNTNGLLVALMVLLNVRLGYWVPNPKRLAEWIAPRKSRSYACREHRKRVRHTPGRCACGRILVPRSQLHERFRWRIPPRLIFAELLSSPDEERPWVNLSDGGHLENLATYELLRRRCRYIIVGDGEGDPNLTFGGLATLQRFARIDMGIEIEILLDDLRLDDERNSYQHAALGKIHYPKVDGGPGKETGYLLYVKLSVTGDEDEVVHEYRSRNEAFPHQSTGDQFFDEGQFEAYRALGYHATDGLFAKKDERFDDFKGFTEWFEDLQEDLAPRLAAEQLFLELQEELSAIEEMLQDPELESYFYELNGHLPKPLSSPAPDARKLQRVVGSQLRLMENVYVALDLKRSHNWENPGNGNWTSILQRWAAAPSFERAYPDAVKLHREDFARFCHRRLELPDVSGRAA